MNTYILTKYPETDTIVLMDDVLDIGDPADMIIGFGVEDEVDLTELFTSLSGGAAEVDNINDFARLNPSG